jgi:secreted trypsin-like serine protease
MASTLQCGSRIITATLIILGVCSSSSMAAPREYEAAMRHWSAKDRDSTKILQGNDVAPNSHQWQVAILRADIPENFYAQFCGGTHVGSGWIITAAHCVVGLGSTDIEVFAGSISLDTGGRRYKVLEVVPYPKYDDQTLIGDIALIRVAGLVISTIALVTPSVSAAALRPETNIVVSGWGVTDTVENRKSNTLKEVNLPYQTNKTCNGPESYNKTIKPVMFCAGEMAGGADACTYDSGGPAIAYIVSKPVLLGVVSFGDDCGQPKKFGVYTRVLPYRDWIKKMVWAKHRRSQL